MSDFLTRRALIARGVSALSAAIVLPALRPARNPGTPMLVYKDPNCGCCKAWTDIMRSSGFEVSAQDTAAMGAIKQRYKVPAALTSCHTALVGGYTIEGHVPADVIRKLLAEKPKVLGLAVPGMPVGSPGMEGSPREAYSVMTFDAAGKTSVFAKR